jgi:glycosyltransferase involved in cell wall biosynthesis
MKVAYYSPQPPERSGIADYSALLLPALAERIDVDVVRRGSRRLRKRTDVSLYHVGNDPDAHGWIVEALRRRPGIVVLHDFVLHHLVAGMTLGRGEGGGYLDAMQREAGSVGRMLAHGVIDGLLPPLWEARAAEYPLAGEVLASTTGLIVHSAYVERLVRDSGYREPVWRIAHPAWPPPVGIAAPVELPAGRTIIGCYGHLNPAKRLPQLLEAFAHLRRRVPEALLLLVGSLSPGLELDPVYDRLGLREGEDVIRVDYVDEARLWSLLSACEVCVNLRHPTMGEASGIVVRALSLGRPLVVSDVGWFAELPDEAAVKVPIGEGEVLAIADALELLVRDPELRRRMGEAACALAQGEHQLERVADAYVAALEEAAGGTVVQDVVLGEIARAAEETGLPVNGRALSDVAERLREVGPGR